MTRCDEIRARLSDVVDGTAGDDTAAIRAHLDACDDCRRLADDLARLRDAARSLGPIAPPDDVWLRVAGQRRLDDRPRPVGDARPASATRQWIGLAAALILITLGIYAVQQMMAVDPPAGNVVAAPSVEGVNEELTQALDHYESAITQLRQLAVTGNESLDPAVAATFDRNMEILDTAIAESRLALESDPTSQPARASLLEALSQKVNVLQATVLLINEMRQGDAAGAAEVAAGSGRSS